jgi:3-hydroxyacyl-CoA dehydrogenase
MQMIVRRTAVLGAGTMGAQIAGHLANAGYPVLLLDITREAAERGLRLLEKASPQPLFVPDRIRRIEAGSFEDELTRLQESDWTVEAVVEDAKIKRGLLERVDEVRKPGSLITTNTSGLSVNALAEGRSEDFRRHWFGTHFFNPPRYMKLLEIIPTPDTDPNTLQRFEHFAEVMLGKGVVRANDTPNFIANRVGLYAALRTIQLMQEFGFTIEEVDRLTGSLIGRPKTGTFRTMDLVGLDIFAHVAQNVYDNAPGDPERDVFRIPPFVSGMLERKMLGMKTGGGFYKKNGDRILSLDPATLEYREQRKASFPALEMIAGVENLSERLPVLLNTRDRASEFVWKLLMSTFTYAAGRIPEISDNIVAVDRAMRWGFGWELGPFEMWDIIGLQRSVQRWNKENHEVPNLAGAASGVGGFYKDSQVFIPIEEAYRPVDVPQGWTILKNRRVIKTNAGATLRDIEDGVACLEFHSKMNTIGGDIVEMLFAGLDEVNANFQGLVIGNQGPHFSAGANLMLLMMAAAEGEWDEIHQMVRLFQRATRAIKYNPKPVVAAPFGMTLGGGCEFAISACRIQASAETYIGLVETGAGLIPAGGGCTEMVGRAHDRIRDVFQNIGLGKVSSSAEDGRRLLYLRPQDGITMNPDRLIHDAKSVVLELAAEGYRPPVSVDLPVLGQSAMAELKLGIHLMQKAGHITDHEAEIARKLAFILCGGEAIQPTTAPEQYFLDLEREAFVSLCGQPKTLARMEHLLKKGKVLRN